jgi:Sucrase/ferredoxin-like
MTDIILAQKPAPAKQLHRLFFIATVQPTETWPRRFGEDEFIDHAADSAIRKLKGEAAYIYHDDVDSSVMKQERPKIWVFSPKWNGASKIYRGLEVEEIMSDLDKVNSATNRCEVHHGRIFFVCGHGNRDERCGDRGKRVLSALRNLNETAFACSHLGGHAFAGNVLSLPKAAWYSLVENGNVLEVVDEQVKSAYFRGCSW